MQATVEINENTGEAMFRIIGEKTDIRLPMDQDISMAKAVKEKVKECYADSSLDHPRQFRWLAKVLYLFATSPLYSTQIYLIWLLDNLKYMGHFHEALTRLGETGLLSGENQAQNLDRLIRSIKHSYPLSVAIHSLTKMGSRHMRGGATLDEKQGMYEFFLEDTANCVAISEVYDWLSLMKLYDFNDRVNFMYAMNFKSRIEDIADALKSSRSLQYSYSLGLDWFDPRWQRVYDFVLHYACKSNVRGKITVEQIISDLKQDAQDASVTGVAGIRSYKTGAEIRYGKVELVNIFYPSSPAADTKKDFKTEAIVINGMVEVANVHHQSSLVADVKKDYKESTANNKTATSAAASALKIEAINRVAATAMNSLFSGNNTSNLDVKDSNANAAAVTSNSRYLK